jgi:hypothetical protein
MGLKSAEADKKHSRREKYQPRFDTDEIQIFFILYFLIFTNFSSLPLQIRCRSYGA